MNWIKSNKNNLLNSLVAWFVVGLKFKNVAIKKLDPCGHQRESECLVEIIMLAVLCHENIVKLVGYCADGGHIMVVYAYMSPRSLEDHIHCNKTLFYSPDNSLKSKSWVMCFFFRRYIWERSFRLEHKDADSFRSG